MGNTTERRRRQHAITYGEEPTAVKADIQSPHLPAFAPGGHDHTGVPVGGLGSGFGRVSSVILSKDIQYASERFNIERIQEFGELAAAARRLIGKQPPELKADPDAQKLTAACVERSWVIIRLINTRPSRLGFVEDYEFSRTTIEEA